MVRGDGPHYPVPGYPPGPPPAHRVEIWVGAYRPRGLRLIGRMADGWVPSIGNTGIDGLRDGAKRLDDAALAAGRDPKSIKRIVNVGGLVTDGPTGDNPLDGPVDRWVATLTDLAVDIGIDAFVFWHADRRSLERYASEVVPAVREAL